MGLIPTRSKYPRLILFDVEGTLVHSKHFRYSPLIDTLQIQFGHLQVADHIFKDWKTDVAIAKDILNYNSIEINDETKEKIILGIRDLPQLIQSGVANHKYEFEMVDNTEFVLRSLAVRAEVRLGLLSTDSMPVAGQKLDLVGHNTSLFEGRFKRGITKPMGAFGSDADKKHDLVPIAVNQFCEYLEVDLSEIAPHDVIVVGDDPEDIVIAHDSGVPIISVGTTFPDPYLFLGTEHYMPDFLDLGNSVAKILATEIKTDKKRKASELPPSPKKEELSE